MRHTTVKDIEMWCCRTHPQWSIQALINCSKKHNVELPFFDYNSFFQYLTVECQSDDRTYISWLCTPDKKSFCQHISSKWESVQDLLKNLDHDNSTTDTDNENANTEKIHVTVPFLHFDKVEVMNKKGELKKRLKTVKTDASMTYLLNFIDQLISFVYAAYS